jgi:hypothetical protein
MSQKEATKMALNKANSYRMDGVIQNYETRQSPDDELMIRFILPPDKTRRKNDPLFDKLRRSMIKLPHIHFVSQKNSPDDEESITFIARDYYSLLDILPALKSGVLALKLYISPWFEALKFSLSF